MTHIQGSQPQSLFDSIKTFTVRVPVNEPVNLFTLAGLCTATINAACVDYLCVDGKYGPVFHNPSCLGYPDPENEDSTLYNLSIEHEITATGFIKGNGDCHITVNASNEEVTGCVITFNYRLES